MTDLRDSILQALKTERSASIVQLAARFDVTYEAIRQHMMQLEDDGIVTHQIPRNEYHDASAGRPPAMYSLTPVGENEFPKRYDALGSAILSSLARDADALNETLGAITDARVDHWQGRMRGRMIERRLELLRGFYELHDPFMQSGEDERGLWLAEYNCPYYNVAMAHPAICSTTVTALSRLVGHEVTRDERFQEGDGRCVFRVDLDRRVDESARGFEQEPEQ